MLASVIAVIRQQRAQRYRRHISHLQGAYKLLGIRRHNCVTRQQHQRFLNKFFNAIICQMSEYCGLEYNLERL